jgi:hypothetical protein
MKWIEFSWVSWLAAPLFVIGRMTLAGAAMAQCEGATVSTLVSPDDNWVVLVQEVVCSGVGFGTTAITDSVQIVRRG